MERVAIVFFLISISLSINGCSLGPDAIEPDWTTYPRGKMVEHPVKMWVAPSFSYQGRTQVTSSERSEPIYESERKQQHSITYDFIQTKHGDTAEKEIFITGEKRTKIFEEKLLNLIPFHGKKICGGDYRVSETHYYFGDEATIRMRGIEGPALKVTYRCPVFNPDNESTKENLIRKIAKDLNDQIYFDVLSKNFPVSEDTLYKTILVVSEREGMPLVNEGNIDGVRYVIAGKHPNLIRWGRIEQLVAYTRKQDGGASITFMLLAYQNTYHRRGVFNHASTSRRGVGPWNRQVSYTRAKYFLAKVNDALQSRTH